MAIMVNHSEPKLTFISLRACLHDWRKTFITMCHNYVSEYQASFSTKSKRYFSDPEPYTCKNMSMKRMEEEGEEDDLKRMKTAVKFHLGDCHEDKDALYEAFMLLHSFETFSQQPSEESAKSLTQLFDRGKSCYNELFTPEKIDNFFDSLRTVLVNECSKGADRENRESQGSDRESIHSENINFQDYNVNLDSQPRSISEEVSEIDLEKQKSSTPLPKFENNEKNFENSSEVLTSIKAKIFVTSYQNPSIDQPLLKKGKSKKVEMKIHVEDSIIDEEIDASKSLKCKDQETLRALKGENHSLRKQVKSLKIENREILAELGQIIVEKTAKENEERKSELFQQKFRSSSPEAKGAVVSTNNVKPDTEDDRLGYPNDSHVNGNGSPNGFPNPQTTNEKGDPVNASVVYTAAYGEQPVLGAEALVQGSNQQPEKEEMVTHYKVQGGDQDSTGEIRAMQKESERGEKTNGEEGINESGKVKGTSVLASTSREESGEQSSMQQSYEDLSFSVQQDDSNGREYISLGNVPPTSVATTLYNNYKLLLLSVGQILLSSDVVKLKDWATQDFSIENAQNATDVLFQLDQKRIINASDLNPLRDFFESIVRIDLVHIIDAFLLGDYTLLRQIQALKKRDANRAQNPQYGSTSRYPSLFNTVSSSPSFSQGSRTAGRNVAASGSSQMSTNRNLATSRKPENSNGPQSSVPQQNHQPAFPSFLPYPNTNNPKLVSRSPNENQSTAHEQRNVKPIATGFTETSVVVADGPVTNERRTTASNSSTRTNPPVKNNARITVGSNGSKHSKFQPPGTERGVVSFARAPNPSRNQDLELESNWLCSHYKRLCYVKFECCDNFWPCHRCHNNQSTCGRKKLKSRDTQMVKCVYCNKVQQFGQFCCDCGAEFASYFCGLCQHLTGNDDHPYHCEKCGICRIHGDRSFHCDICGVCLDVQLRGNHKCREGSAHDECCICLEDAFTGCQILPCSHKVHKECATQMIRSGITRCPICRESFAHKLERRPMPNSRKRSGK